jgi:hypothetical protein
LVLGDIAPGYRLQWRWPGTRRIPPRGSARRACPAGVYLPGGLHAV